MKIIKPFILFISILFISSCNIPASVSIKNKLSDNRLGIYCAYSDFCYVEFTYGYREAPFAYDGISESKVPFGVIMLWFNEIVNENFIEIELEYDDNKEYIVLEKSPYEDCFGKDIGKLIEPKNMSIKILNGDNSQKQIVLYNKSNNWQISNVLAMQIAEEYFQNDFNAFTQSGEDFECYLKILSNQSYEQFFWFFSYYSSSGKRAQIAIDVNTGKVVANAN